MFINVNKSRLSAQPLLSTVLFIYKTELLGSSKLTAHFNAASEVISGK